MLVAYIICGSVSFFASIQTSVCLYLLQGLLRVHCGVNIKKYLFVFCPVSACFGGCEGKTAAGLSTHGQTNHGKGDSTS